MTTFPKPQPLIASNIIIRPADTTPYTIGDLIANNVTAGSVVPFSFANVVRQTGYKSIIERVGVLASQNLLTNGSFRVHFLSAAPTVTNGDNGALDIATNLNKYLGAYDVALTAGGTAQGAIGFGGPAVGSRINWTSISASGLWALLEARAAYVPTSAETFQLFLENQVF